LFKEQKQKNLIRYLVSFIAVIFSLKCVVHPPCFLFYFCDTQGK
ncbi:MAG: hypothetical protein ACI85I_002669, partial [Arenicella sp.]